VIVHTVQGSFFGAPKEFEKGDKSKMNKRRDKFFTYFILDILSELHQSPLGLRLAAKTFEKRIEHRYK